MACNGRKPLAQISAAGIVILGLLAACVPASARVITLDDCVAIAVESNGSLGQARENVATAGANLMASWSGALPQISASISRTNYLNVIEGIDGESKVTSGQIGLNQVLFDGTTFARIAGAYHTRDASEYSLDWTTRDVVFGAKELYYGLLKAEKLDQVAEENLELANEQLRKTESLFELGSASRSDLLKAQVQVQQAELTLITAQKGVGTSRAGLRLYLALDPLEPIEVVDPPESEEEVDFLDYDLEAAIARRPDITSFEETVMAAKRSVLASQAAWLPDLDLSVSYAGNPDNVTELLDQVRNDYTRSVSVRLSVPIFTGLATKAGVDNSKASLRSLELSLRDARLQAAYEIETARLTLLEQKESVDVAEKAVAQAEEDLSISEERFRLRAASMLDRIDARVGYSTARAEYVRARYDYEIAKADMKRVLGL